MSHLTTSLLTVNKHPLEMEKRNLLCIHFPFHFEEKITSLDLIDDCMKKHFSGTLRQMQGWVPWDMSHCSRKYAILHKICLIVPYIGYSETLSHCSISMVSLFPVHCITVPSALSHCTHCIISLLPLNGFTLLISLPAAIASMHINAPTPHH